jgi:hypothetical protein
LGYRTSYFEKEFLSAPIHSPPLWLPIRSFSNLCRKLGLPAAKLDPIDEVLRDFIGMFQSPLPSHIVEALTAIFSLDDDDTEMLDNALLQHAGPAIAELPIQVAES